MKIISNEIVYYKLLALIPLGITFAAGSIHFLEYKNGFPITLSISVVGLIAFIYMLFKTENTVALFYNYDEKQIIIKKHKEEIVVPISDILSFRKELDYQSSYPDFMDSSKTIYGITVKIDGKPKAFSFAIWDSQNEFQENYNILRMNSIIERKKLYRST